MNSISASDAYTIKTYNGLVASLDANGNIESGLNATVRQVLGSQVSFVGYILHNNDAARRWVQVFFRPASEVVLGTTVPNYTISVGASGSVAWDFYRPIRQGTGLSLACTTTEIGSTGATAAMTGSIYYK